MKLLLADNNVGVGNVVGGRHDAFKITKMTKATITYQRVGYRGRSGDLFSFDSDEAMKPSNVGETKTPVHKFIMDNLDLGSLALTQYNSR